MCASPRKYIIEPGKVGYCHCIAETSRQAFLCGKSGRLNVDHRMKWVTDRLTQLASSFAVDIGAFGIIDTKLHVLVRQRPDVAKTWNATEIERKWQGIFDKLIRSQTELRLERTQSKAGTIQNKVLDERRDRLASASWFMRCLNEIVARAANREEGVRGRFWAGRFRSQAILEDGAALACSAFVDLRRVIAGKAGAPANGQTSWEVRKPGRKSASEATIALREALAPFDDGGKKAAKPKQRASNDSWLPISTQEYLNLLEWTADQIHRKRSSEIPSDIHQLLTRFKIDPEYWLECVGNFDTIFRHASGSPQALAKHVALTDKRWHRGLAFARKVFG